MRLRPVVVTGWRTFVHVVNLFLLFMFFSKERSARFVGARADDAIYLEQRLHPALCCSMPAVVEV